jgi:hypothetical protein
VAEIVIAVQFFSDTVELEHLHDLLSRLRQTLVMAIEPTDELEAIDSRDIAQNMTDQVEDIEAVFALAQKVPEVARRGGYSLWLSVKRKG